MYNNSLKRLYLFSVIDSLHPGRNRSENFIRDCIEFFCDFGDGQLFSEYFNSVTRFTIYIGYIDHAYVHTNITYDGSSFSVYNDTPFSISQMAVESVGIPRELPLCGNRKIIHLFFRTLWFLPADSVLIWRIVVFNVLTVSSPQGVSIGETPYNPIPSLTISIWYSGKRNIPAVFSMCCSILCLECCCR